jgi:hypothetical protein
MHVLQEWKQNIYFRRHELIEDIGSPYFQSLLVMGRGCWDMEMGCLATTFSSRLLAVGLSGLHIPGDRVLWLVLPKNHLEQFSMQTPGPYPQRRRFIECRVLVRTQHFN